MGVILVDYLHRHRSRIKTYAVHYVKEGPKMDTIDSGPVYATGK